jgi:hypothetical protein
MLVSLYKRSTSLPRPDDLKNIYLLIKYKGGGGVG